VAVSFFQNPALDRESNTHPTLWPSKTVKRVRIIFENIWYMGWTTIQKSIPLGCHFSHSFRSIRILFYFLGGVSSVSTRDAEGPGDYGIGVFIGQDVDGVGDVDSRNTIMVDTETLLEAVLKDLQTWEYFPPLSKY